MKRGAVFARLLCLTLLLFSLSISPARAEKQEVREALTRLSILSDKISLGGVSVNYVEAGKGPPLLFLHGLGGSWKDWAAVLPAFASAYHVLAMDFPGFGDSDKPDAEYTIDWLTGIVGKFLEAKGLDGVILAGHSMGAVVALNIAARPDSPVRKLAITDPVGIGDKAEFISYVLTKKILGEESSWGSVEGTMREKFKGMVERFVKNRKPGTAREFFESVPGVPFSETPLLPMTPSVQMSASIIDFDIRPRLSFIRQPTLILWGEKDPIARSQDAPWLQKEIRNSRLVLFPGVGHSPMMEDPVRYNEELQKFLQEGDASGPAR